MVNFLSTNILTSTKKKVNRTTIKIICCWHKFYSNSSLSSCYEVFFVGFDGRKQGVLSDFYLLRESSRDYIVILLSLISYAPIIPQDMEIGS